MSDFSFQFNPLFGIIIAERKTMPEKLIEILDTLQEDYASRNMVLKLCSKDITEYGRGRVDGEMRMLTKINLALLAGNEKG